MSQMDRFTYHDYQQQHQALLKAADQSRLLREASKSVKSRRGLLHQWQMFKNMAARIMNDGLQQRQAAQQLTDALYPSETR